MYTETKMPTFSAKMGTQDNLVTTLDVNSTRFTAPLPNLPITYSRGANQYDNQPDQRVATSWEEFWRNLAKDRGTAKGQQYVCGSMKLGKHPDEDKYPHEAHYRRKDGAEDCLFLPFDCDHIPADVFGPLLVILGEFEGCSYTTSSHTPETPRARLFVALSRPVTREERMRLGKAFERYVESRGVAGVQFDAAVYQTEQMCYLPLNTAVFNYHKGGVALDVDALLNSEFVGGVRDSNSGPSTTKEKKHYPKLTLEQLEIVLFHIDPDNEQAWSDSANSLARVYGEDGREFFHLYSMQSKAIPTKYNYDTCEERYNRALRDADNRPEGYGTKHLIELASTHPDWPKVALKFLHWGETLPIHRLFGDVEGVRVPKQLELALDDAAVADVNKSFVWDNQKMKIYSLKTRMYAYKPDFLDHYSNQTVQVGKGSMPLGRFWMQSPNRREVNGLVLAPGEGEITATGAFNTWRGYSCEPIEGDITPFTVVFNHLLPDSQARGHTLKWLAKLIQNPETPFKTALAIYGRMQGTGKNTVFETVGELLHAQHWGVIGNAQLTGSFNDWQLDKVFVIGDEISNASSRSEADLMKRYITATENNINPKGLPAIRQPNLIKYVLLSNREEIVHIEGEDRRYYVAETTSTPLPKHMADRFYAWKNAGGLSHLLHYLLNYDTSGFDPTAPAPMSAAKAEVIEAGKSGLDTWVEEEISERVAKGKTLASAVEVLNAYKRTTHLSPHKNAVSNALKRAGAAKVPKQAVLKSGRRVRLYSLDEHEQYKSMSETMLGEKYESMAYLS